MKPAPRPRGARGRARSFRNNAFVTGGFGVRFYVGTPLVASDGHRLGTLCFADAAPRAFDAERCNILNNMAELVVRELERGWAMRRARKSAAQMQQARPGARGAGGRLHPCARVSLASCAAPRWRSAQAPARRHGAALGLRRAQRSRGRAPCRARRAAAQVNQGLLRAMDCFQEAIMMVDARPPGWRIMHLNQAAIAQTGAPPAPCAPGAGHSLWGPPHATSARAWLARQAPGRSGTRAGRRGPWAAARPRAVSEQERCRPAWRERAQRRAGIEREAGLAGRFWDLFERPHQSAASSASAGPGWAAAAAAGEAFALHDVARRSSRPCPSSGSSRASERHFSLSFRCGHARPRAAV